MKEPNQQPFRRLAGLLNLDSLSLHALVPNLEGRQPGYA